MRSKNLTFFDTVSPAIATAVRAAAEPRKFPVWQDDPPEPKRFLFRPPSLKTTNRHLLFDYVQDLYAATQGAIIEQEPRSGAGYLFLFGCPQQGDIGELIRKTPVRGLVLCEADPAAFAATIDTTDWSSIAATLEARSGRIRFVLAKGASLLSTLMQDAVRDRNYGLIDGSYYRLGRSGDDIEAVYRQFESHLSNLATSVGFFEDELKMVGNVVENMKKRGLATPHRHRVIAKGAAVRNDLTAVIIGSGPSAESTVQLLAGSLPGHAVILTAGTGLGVALAHGIRPDFHCEIENVDELQEVIAPIADRHDLRTIPLVGPSALSPNTVRFFETHHSYIREGTCASALYGEAPPILHNASPTVANVAVRIAIALGARTILLAGVDFGAIDPSQHHAKSSVYGTVPASAIPVSLGFAPFDVRVDGNFGTPVLSSQSFMVGAQAMGQLIDRYPDRTFLNIGDGALIHGATACRADQAAAVLERSVLLPGDASLLLDATMTETHYTGWPDLKPKWSAWRSRLENSLNHVDQPDDYTEYYDRLTKSVFAPDTDIRLAGLVYGTFMMMLQVSAYLALRMDETQQENLVAVTNRLLQKHIATIDGGMEHLLKKLNIN